MADPNPPSNENVLPLRDTILQHVDELLRAADSLAERDRLPNIAFHLAVLALEELGKLELIEMAAFVKDEGFLQETTTPAERFVDDHVGKLFWAIWGPTFGRAEITGDQLALYQGLARDLHAQRLSGLYVDVPSADHTGPVRVPRSSVSDEQASSVMQLARTRLDVARTRGERELDTADRELLGWFWEADRDPEKRRVILSQESMKELAARGSSRHWMAWLRERFADDRRRIEEYVQQELNRPRNPTDPAPARWRIRLRLISASHSLRTKVFAKWNTTISPVQLEVISGKKGEIFADLILDDRVPLAAVWDAGWDMAQRFIVALNVGTRGYFYWFLPQHTRRYFEKLSDLSTGEQLRVERNPVLEIDWGKKDALNDEDLARTAIVFGFVLRQHKHPAFDHYLLGLALLSKTDIHTRLEAQAVEEFFVALCEGMRLFGDWDGNEPVLTACARAFGDLLEPSELEQFVSKGAHARGDVSLTLSDAGMMKLVCDAYLFRKAEQIYRSTLNRKN